MAVDGVSDVLRFSGMSSGLDTDSIVDSLTQIDQMKVDSAEQDKMRLEYKAEQLREVNLTLKTFDEKYNSLLSSNSMVSSSTYNTFSVTTGGNTSAATITAGASADVGSMQIDSISQLAEVAKVESSTLFTEAFDASRDNVLSTELKDLDFAGTSLSFDANSEISFSINDVDFTFDSTDTVQDMLSEINSSSAEVKMSYSSLKEGFKLTSTNTGSSETIKIVNGSGNAFAANATDGAFGIATGTYNGQNAELVIEGINVEKSSNSFTIDGVSYSLNETTNDAVTFNISRDVDSTVDAVVEYIDSYNTLIADLNARIDEEYYRDYAPLTDAQREEMSESEIESWEEKSQSGALRNNFAISSTLSKMRSAFYEAVAQTGMSPSDIGLNTTASYLQNGKIEVDEDKLRQAIIDNPSTVEDVFISIPDSDSTDETADSGLIYRISDIVSNHISNTKEVDIASTDSSIENAEERIEDLMDRLEANRQLQWNKFNALEVALSQMNSQWSALAAQLGAGSASS